MCNPILSPTNEFVYRYGRARIRKNQFNSGLETKGFHVFQEASRMVIFEQQKKSNGILPWTDLEGFQHLVFDLQKRDYQTAKSLDKVVFMDRGLPDGLGYMKSGGLFIPKELKLNIQEFPYANTAFVS